MPSLTATSVANNYLKNTLANGLGPRTIILKLEATNITNTQLNAWINYLTSAQGSAGTGDSAFVVAGLSSDGTNGAFVSGTSDVVYLALQGTGTFTDGTVEALTGTPTATILATFDQGYQAV
jgi:hypothetical protein